MNKYIGILRGINVSGKNKLKMVDLNALCEELGFTNISTYIQSGNIAFESVMDSPSAIERTLKDGIMKKFGYDVPTLILQEAELDQIIAGCPFTSIVEDKKSIYYTFLSEEPEQDLVDGLKALDFSPDQIVPGDRVVYVHVPVGYGKTKFNNNFIEKKLGVSATTRNWNTTQKLLSMLKEL